MPLEALIFDVDGTLAETEELHRRAFNRAFADAGLDWIWSQDLYRQLLRVTGGKERLRHYVETYAPSQTVSDAQIAMIHTAKNALYAELVAASEAKPRPGVRRLIAEARQCGLRMAIATTTSPSNVEALLQASFGGASWCTFIAAGDCVAAKKPEPDVYECVLGKLGLAAPDCIAFEDSRNGVIAARRAGIAVVATPSFYSSDDDFSAATVVVSDLGETGVPFRHLAGAKIDGDSVDVGWLRALIDLTPRSVALETKAARR
jgi:HAD superfamily hydrolase (TIGR01509 family)